MAIRETTPARQPDRYLIEAYGNGGFRSAGQRREGSIIITAAAVQPWPVASVQGLDLEAFRPLIDMAERIDVLLLGCGTLPILPDRALQQMLRENGLKLDMMTTAAACRTYNVLVAEDRRVAAALIAVS